MGMLFKLFLVGGALTAAWFSIQWRKSVPIPQLKDEWWGEGKARPVDDKVKPFKINIPDSVLDDLKDRLSRANRIVQPLEGVAFEYGFNTNFLKKVVDYWRSTYDWRTRESLLNKFPQFKTNINGLGIHFIQSKPKADVAKGKKVLPLLILHGWPGSFVELTKMIPLLTAESKDRDFVFEVVVPSLPGYGFSDAARKPGMGPTEMGLVFDRLMKRLGYERYYVQGGDCGAFIGSAMATLYPEKLSGLHLNTLAVNSPSARALTFFGSLWPSMIVPADKVDLFYPLGSKFLYVLQETGYMHLQATKPDTVGVALSDSPVGLAAYIIEKFSTWTRKTGVKDADGGLLDKFTMDELLDNVMIYWVTNSITTSMRLYSEALSAKTFGYNLDSIVSVVPIGVALFKEDLLIQAEPVAKLKFQRLLSCNIMPKGGHFAAYEEPNLLAEDVLQFVAKAEKL